jgi:hypothetical protein
MSDFDYLLDLPGKGRERRWLRERLETLSVREGITLSAAVQRTQPRDMEQAINCLQSLDSYTMRLNAGSYAALGQGYLLNDTAMPMDAFPFVDLTALGQRYEDKHPGLFVGNCYVQYPKEAPAPAYHRGGPLPEDSDWGVKLKLASPAVPEGVWLRLPGQDFCGDESSTEETLVLQELWVKRWDECGLLDARCVLPQIENLPAQYDSVANLIYDGSNLGYVLAEHGQGAPGFMEKYTAALALEGCHDLRLALDISQNLGCYDWLPCDGPEGFAAKHLRDAGVPDGLIHSGGIDLNSYGQHLLDELGYLPAAGDGGYIRRNSQEFTYQYSTPTPEQSGMSMQ